MFPTRSPWLEVPAAPNDFRSRAGSKFVAIFGIDLRTLALFRVMPGARSSSWISWCVHGTSPRIIRTKAFAARGPARRYRTMGSFAPPDKRLAQDSGAAVHAGRSRCLGVARRLSHARCDHLVLATAAVIAGSEPGDHAGRRHAFVPAAVLGHFSPARCPVFR